MEAVSVIVGLGDTGVSVAKYFARLGEKFMVVDSRESPPGLDELKRLLPDVTVELGEFQLATFLQAKQLVVSPGLSLKLAVIEKARQAGVPITGDIDIFSKAVTAPIIAVTGSNGKSTVVAIVADILRKAGKKVGLGGNLDGVNFKPALDLLTEEFCEVDFYVLELSSFQLETTVNLGAAVAVVLNISPDHMDRYTDLNEYMQAKARIFNDCRQVVVNRDEAIFTPPAVSAPVWSFGLDEPGMQALGLIEVGGNTYLACGEEKILPLQELKIVGQHNVSNALAAMALTLAIGIDKEAVRETLREFAGLTHRCQWVAQIAEVDFYNDSKGTNIGATMAAVTGLGSKLSGKVVLIAGGIGKGAEFALLAPVVRQWVKALVLIGQDAQLIATECEGATEIEFAENMQDAVVKAAQHAESGDAVLLSPACASFDMFKNFQHRGQKFMEAVESMR